MDNTREKIINCALDLFAVNDYSAVSMEKLSRAVGIKKASLYFHFNGKKEIFRAVLDFVMAEYEQLISDLTGGSDNERGLFSSLYSFLCGYIEYLNKKTVLQFWTRLYILPPDILPKSELEQYKKADETMLNQLSVILQRYSADQPETTAMLLMRLIGGYISIGVDDMPLPWKEELSSELKLILKCTD